MNYNKLIYTLPALALFVASCSQDEPGNSPVIEKGRIEFRASLPEVSSRSTEVTPDNLEEFTVSCFIDGSSTGTAYFHGKTFSRNAATRSYFSRDPECI